MSLSPSIDTVEPPVSFFCIGQAADREHQCEHRAYCLKINRSLKYSVLELFKPKVTLVPNTWGCFRFAGVYFLFSSIQ